MNPYQRYLLEEFADEYHERRMSRRDLLRRAVLIMGTAPAAAAALIAVGCGGDDKQPATGVAPAALPSSSPTQQPAASATTAAASAAATPATTPTQAKGVFSDITFKGSGSDLLGYLARPAPTGTYPGIVIIHENRGLVEHTKDVARRYAGQGFVALAVDLVSRAGGSQADAARNTGALGSAKIDDLIADLKSYIAYLKVLDGVKPGGVGVTGFCFGGGYAFEAAIASPDVKAAVPYYGICRLIDDLPKTQAAVLAIYGALDNRVTSQSGKVKEQLAKTGKPFEVKVYDGANHAFFNDTGASYNATAAADAWPKTLDWFRKHV